MCKNVSLTYTIFRDGVVINHIVADEAFCQRYCAAYGYTYAQDPDQDIQPSHEEQLRADVDFLAALAGMKL